jgi:hypothetical protein
LTCSMRLVKGLVSTVGHSSDSTSRKIWLL